MDRNRARKTIQMQRSQLVSAREKGKAECGGGVSAGCIRNSVVRADCPAVAPEAKALGADGGGGEEEQENIPG